MWRQSIAGKPSPVGTGGAKFDPEAGVRVDHAAEADLDGPTLAAAVVVGSTRLIDNVLLDAEA
jgi:hypothetical protein